MVKIKVPGTSANIGPGFDTLGLALNIFNEITVEKKNSGIEVLWDIPNPNIPLEDLQKISIPVHVLAGEKDVIKLEHTKLIANNIKNSTLEIIKGEKHGSYIIHSDKIYKIIKKYLED